MAIVFKQKGKYWWFEEGTYKGEKHDINIDPPGKDYKDFLNKHYVNVYSDDRDRPSPSVAKFDQVHAMISLKSKIDKEVKYIIKKHLKTGSKFNKDAFETELKSAFAQIISLNNGSEEKTYDLNSLIAVMNIPKPEEISTFYNSFVEVTTDTLTEAASTAGFVELEIMDNIVSSMKPFIISFTNDLNNSLLKAINDKLNEKIAEQKKLLEEGYGADGKGGKLAELMERKADLEKINAEAAFGPEEEKKLKDAQEELKKLPKPIQDALKLYGDNREVDFANAEEITKLAEELGTLRAEIETLDGEKLKIARKWYALKWTSITGGLTDEEKAKFEKSIQKFEEIAKANIESMRK